MAASWHLGAVASKSPHFTPTLTRSAQFAPFRHVTIHLGEV